MTDFHLDVVTAGRRVAPVSVPYAFRTPAARGPRPLGRMTPAQGEAGSLRSAGGPVRPRALWASCGRPGCSARARGTPPCALGERCVRLSRVRHRTGGVSRPAGAAGNSPAHRGRAGGM